MLAPSAPDAALPRLDGEALAEAARTDPDGLARLVDEHDAVIAWFAQPSCSICTVLQPQVAELAARRFPRARFAVLDVAAHPEAIHRHRILAAPTVVAWFGGREWVRLGRGFGLVELERALARPYALCFGEG